MFHVPTKRQPVLDRKECVAWRGGGEGRGVSEEGAESVCRLDDEMSEETSEDVVSLEGSPRAVEPVCDSVS
jgi:hypothetical protein